jgi:DNA-binding LacI/PurR family transcriptional regulator
MLAAKKLDYRPNLLARSLITGRSGIVGVVMGNPRNPFVSNSTTNQDRQSAFVNYVIEQGLPEPQCVEGHFQRAGTMAAARSLLSQRRRPDAIFCASDYMAIATIEVARHEFNMAVGRELGIVGFDGIEEASWPSFDLTTFEQPLHTMIDSVVAILDDPTAESAKRITLTGNLQCRGSTQRD